MNGHMSALLVLVIALSFAAACGIPVCEACGGGVRSLSTDAPLGALARFAVACTAGAGLPVGHLGILSGTTVSAVELAPAVSGGPSPLRI